MFKFKFLREPAKWKQQQKTERGTISCFQKKFFLQTTSFVLQGYCLLDLYTCRRNGTLLFP